MQPALIPRFGHVTDTSAPQRLPRPSLITLTRRGPAKQRVPLCEAGIGNGSSTSRQRGTMRQLKGRRSPATPIGSAVRGRVPCWACGTKQRTQPKSTSLSLTTHTCSASPSSHAIHGDGLAPSRLLGSCLTTLRVACCFPLCWDGFKPLMSYGEGGKALREKHLHR